LCEEISTIVPASSTKGYRYFCLVEKTRNHLPKKVFEDSRAIYVHAGDDIIHGNALKNAKHLRSITVNYIWSTKVLTAVFQVKNLKYLEISHLVCGELPEAISDISSLQTLYLTSWYLLKLPKSIGNLKKLRTLNLSWCCRLMSLPSSITNLGNLEYLKLEKCNLLMLPRGIGNLTKLKELNSVCVGFDKRYAQISELATLSRISGKLSICFLRRLTDPSDAHRACLKQKEKLHELELSWGSLYDKVNAEHEMAILDGLEPPLRIKRLKISAYGGLQFAWWMLKPVGGGAEGLHQFPFLTKMSLANFPNLKHLDGLVQLPCLEKLRLWDMPALESISGGPFPSLVKLKMYRLHSLGEVWMVTGRTLFGKEEEVCSNQNPHQSGQLQIGSRLTNLYVEGCPKLEVKPYLPTSLEQLRLDSCNSSLLSSPHQGEGSSSSSNFPPSYSHLKVLVLSCMKVAAALSPPLPPGLQSGCRLELLQHMPTLETLEIFHCHDLTELPECLGELCSLQKMTIKYCQSLGSLPRSIGYLTSLEKLEITKCNAFVKIP
jgi:Leucine-rich repeat (LRR) protein